MWTIEALLGNDWQIESEKNYVIIWYVSFNNFNYPLFYYGSWSEMKSFLKKISKPIKISLSLWENKLDDIYKEVLSSDFFEAIDDHKSFYFTLSDASINILDLI